MPDPTDGDKKSPWKYQEAETDDKKEDGGKHTRNDGKTTTPLLEFTKKRGPSAIEELVRRAYVTRYVH